MIKNPILKAFIFPFYLLYVWVIKCRNWFYDKNIFKSQSWDIPLICIGNLHIGGSGKTPFTEWLLANLSQNNLAVLSRGYGRKSTGYKVVKKDGDALEYGDEPLQVKNKYPEIPFIVCENRNEGVQKIKENFTKTNAIILDDAFQHRKINCGLNILLTPYKYLYCNDTFLPIGSLRDDKKSANRAQIIVVSKCPKNIPKSEKEIISKQLKLLPTQQLFFASINYGNRIQILGNNILEHEIETVLLLAGIAHPSILEKELNSIFQNIETAYYADHYNYTVNDINEIISQYKLIKTDKKCIITTEKDLQRLRPYLHLFEGVNLYVQPIETEILFDESKMLLNQIDQFIVTFE